MRHGGKILIDQLAIQGVKAVFTVPGESFLPALDALFDERRVRTIVCRHEGGAAMMAEAWGKLTGRPGVAMVTRGPGAANAISGLHVAQQDSTPMLLIVGLSPSANEDLEGFQEIETKQLFSSMAKWTAVIRDTGRIPEYAGRAFQVAMAGRPGPVVLGIPEDVLSRKVSVRDAILVNRLPGGGPAAHSLQALQAALANAERPLMIVGGPGWSQSASADIEVFAKRFDIPVASAFRAQDRFANRHPNYAGHCGIMIDAKLGSALRSSDLLIYAGPRLDEVTTAGFSLLGGHNPKQRLVHIHPSEDEIGRLVYPHIAIVSPIAAAARALQDLEAPKHVPWEVWRRDLRSAFENWQRPYPVPGTVQLPRVIRELSSALPDDAIITNGAGNYAAFLHRHFTYKKYGTQLAPASGSMGYGLPAAIAAKIATPERTVVALAGDGCFMMTAQELATAVQYALPIVIIVANNNMYGTIRSHQERTFPGRAVATSLVNPDFAALARSFGAAGEAVIRDDQFRPALQRAQTEPGPYVIELKIDPEALAPPQTATKIRSDIEK